MDIIDALIIVATLCLMESRACDKRAKLWDAIADLEERIEKMKAGKK